MAKTEYRSFRTNLPRALGRLGICASAVMLVTGCDARNPIMRELGFTHDLGEFGIASVEFVQETPGPGDGYDGGGHLRIGLVSESELSLEYPTYWLGLAADYCPLEDDHKLIAFGFLQDGTSFFSMPKDLRLKTDADGMYRYEAYVVRAYPPPGKTRDDYGGPKTGPYAQAEYDIIADQSDICLQIFGGDHYNVFARSAEIRIDYDIVRNAAMRAEMIPTHAPR